MGPIGPIAAALALTFAAFSSGAESPFLADCRALTQAPHRLSGTPEYRAAADHVERRLREIGVDRLLAQEFASVQTQVERCALETGGRTLRLLPMRPNGIVPPVSPAEGIRGRLLDAGAGGLADFGERSPRGRIVVLDYNCQRGWLRAFRLGAKAVVFVASGRAESWHAHYTHANANLPRFYYSGPRADLPDGAEATVHSQVVWRAATGRNIIAFLEGTEPVFHQEKAEAIVVAANLDSFGEVPRLAPGARSAASCAALLMLAEHLAKHRPRRHVVVAFLDNQARGHAGCAAFYRALEKDETIVRLDTRQEYLDNETEFLDALAELLGKDDTLAHDSPVRRELVTRLQRQAIGRADRVRTAMALLRTRRAELDDAPARARLDAQLDQWQARRDRWNRLLRALTRGTETGGVEAELHTVLSGVRATASRRSRERAAARRAREADRALDELLGDVWISLHVSLLLGDGSPRWGLVIGGDSALHSRHDDPGLYGKIQGTFLRACEALKEAGAGPAHFEPASADGTLDPPRLLWGAPSLVHSGEIAGKLGIYNLALATSQESLPREGTPDDTLAALDAARVEAQTVELAPLLAAAASQEGLSLRRAIVADKFYVGPEFPKGTKPRGPMVIETVPGSQMGDRPLAGAIAQVLVLPRGEAPYRDLAYQPRKIYAFDDFLLLRTDANGSYTFGPVRRDLRPLRGFAAGFDERGAVAVTSTRGSARQTHYRLNARAARGGAAVLPPQLHPLPAEVFRARGNSPLDDTRSFSQTLDGVVYWYCEPKVGGVKLFGLQAIVGLVNGGEAPGDAAANTQGDGFAMDGTWTLPSAAVRSAADLWRLNESRMQVLRSRGILNSSVEELHGRAEDLLLAANATADVGRSEALAASAFLAERPVYDLTRGTLNDLVRAVLVLLALCVPFAFALERLLIGATSIYRQILWFAGFFTLTFVVLFLSHPAFAISRTPTIIFLGFAIIVLSSLVIVLIMRKFEVELKVLQGLTTTVHAADVSRFSTVMAAMAMGISTMRRRPLRTALTATTIIMLTFTILCFASFGTETGIVKLFVGPSPGYAGAFAHRVSWSALNEAALDVVAARWGSEATLCRRYWVSPRTAQNQGPLLTRADGTRPLALRGVLGLDAAELARRPDLARVFGADHADWDDTVLMTRAVAESLELRPGDMAIVGGRHLRVGPLLDAASVSAAKDMDGNGVLPVDFVEMQSALGQAATGDEALAAQSQQSWAYLPTDSVVTVSCRTARLLGAALHAVTLYTADSRAATAMAEDMARILPLPVSATRADGAYRHVLGTLVQASGAADLVFPILLGGLVIFGTMLGSVADREKEIYTFSSLGLAPPHVASLFFAEAMVYSVLGGLAGYLLAQATMKVLGVLAGYGLVRVPEMNYSSANAIVTILIVMATVLVSSIYPAIKASRSANPGILRTWRLPTPTGDVFDIAFPFTVSEYDITGVVSFLKEHFDNFGDTGLGVFMARDARLVRCPDGQLGLHAALALAPFDLGVTQGFELRSAPSEIPGIDEVTIKLTRTSGQPKDWQRLNKVLLDDLRRQFLIWRALPNETMELYRQRTLAALAEGEQEMRDT